jgi:hypothetical protein
MALYSNQDGKNSHYSAILEHAKNIKTLKIASAFFSFEDVLFEIAGRDIQIQLIVRLGERTSPSALRSLIGHENIQIRYYTSTKFHPKIYIFGDSSAIVGSANLTKSGFSSNNEISITVDKNAYEFDELLSLFSLYWDNARPLDERAINHAAKVLNNAPVTKYDPEKEIEKVLGEVSVPSEIVVRKEKSKSRSYIEDYERSYQTFNRAFSQLRNIYTGMNRRKVSEDKLPLRIEIDQFTNFIRKELAAGDVYNEQPIRSGEELVSFTQAALNQWFNVDFKYLDTVVENYAKINAKFSSVDGIQKLSLEEIFDTLLVCHAFNEQLRHKEGGIAGLKTVFLRDNKEQEVKESICYLLFGKDKFSERMAHCIYGSYKLAYVGKNSIQELLGWVNKEDIPICNLRTLKSLRYLGAIEGKY